MRPLKVFSILTITLLAISTSSCKKTDNETSMLSSLEEQLAKQPLKLTDEEKKIIAENENTLRVYRECERCDLRGAELRGADLNSAILNYSDFREADLREADLSYADFEGAKTGPEHAWLLRGKL